MEQPSSEASPPRETDIVGAPPDDLIDAFYNVDRLQTAVTAIGFDMFEELRLLQRIIRDPDPRISIQGLRHFRSLMKEIGTVSGSIVTARERRIETDDGEVTVREVESGATLQRRLAPSTRQGRFPIAERLPEDRRDSATTEDEPRSDRAVGGSGTRVAELAGHGHGGSGDDRSPDLPETVGLGGELAAAVPEAGGVVPDEEATVE